MREDINILIRRMSQRGVAGIDQVTSGHIPTRSDGLFMYGSGCREVREENADRASGLRWKNHRAGNGIYGGVEEVELVYAL